MFETVQTPILGIIENMSEYVCPRCGKREAISGPAADVGKLTR